MKIMFGETKAQHDWFPIASGILSFSCFTMSAIIIYLYCSTKRLQSQTMNPFVKITFLCLLAACSFQGLMATLGAIGYIDYKKVENIPLQQIYFELPFYAY